MRAIVTGGAGFIGSRLAEALMREGAEVTVIDDLSTGSRERVPKAAKLLVEDIAEPSASRTIAALAPDVVFHLAAQVGVGSSLAAPAHDARTNLLGTLRMLEGCRMSVSRIVFSSSSAVYGDGGEEALTEDKLPKPLAPYGMSKWSAEQYIRMSEAWWSGSFAILRYANVYGPGQSERGEGGVIASFLGRLRAGKPLIVHGDGEQKRDFVHVDDVVAANMAAGARKRNLLCNVGTGVATSINDLAALCETLGRRPAGRVFEPARPGDVRCSRLAAGRAARELGWRPTVGLREGLAAMINPARTSSEAADPPG